MTKRGRPAKPFLDTPVTPKKGRTKPIRVKTASRKQVSGAVARKPEVMLKVTGGASGGRHLKAHLDYITRNAKLEAETDQGEKIRTKEDLRDLAEDWAAGIGKERRNKRDTINTVFSMPAGTNPEGVRLAVRALAREQFAANHQYLMVLHTDQKHPHVHLTIKSEGHDGTRLDPKKADLQKWREAFAEKLQEQGIEATATPRTFRAVVTKGKKQPVYHAEKAGRSTVRDAKLQEALDELRGKPGKPNPARKAIASKQQEVRADYLDLAKELGKSKDRADRELAAQIANFLKAMPKELKDERQMLRDMIISEVERRRAGEKQAGQDRPKNEGPER